MNRPLMTKFNHKAGRFFPRLFIICISLFFPSEIILAQGDFQFDRVILRGTGCPAGSTSTILTPDKKTITVLFDAFSVEVPQFDGDNDNEEISDEHPQAARRSDKEVDHKVCHMILTSKLPVNYNLKSLDVSMDMRGYSFANKGVKLAFKSFFQNFEGLVRSRAKKKTLVMKKWGGEVDENWTISNRIKIPINSKCAHITERAIKINYTNVLKAQMQKRNVSNLRSGLLSMDSSDIVGQLKFKFNIFPCS